MIDKNAGTFYTANTEEISKLLKILDEIEARTREAVELARELEELVGSVVTVDGMPPRQPMNLLDSQPSPENPLHSLPVSEIKGAYSPIGIGKSLSSIPEGEDMPDTSQMERMLPVREVARLLYVHGNTVRRWSDKGIIRAYRISHRGDRRFSREDISQILLELKTKGGNLTKAKHLP